MKLAANADVLTSRYVRSRNATIMPPISGQADAHLRVHVDVRLAVVLVAGLHGREAEEVEIVPRVQVGLGVRQRLAHDPVHHLHRVPLEVQQSVPAQQA